jgi:ketosteroid isomerase-like protein
VHTSGGIRQDSTNVETLRAAIAAFNRRDTDCLETFLADDVRIVPARAAVDGTAYTGAGAGGRWCAGVDAIWEGMTFQVDEVRDCGGSVVALGWMRGRARKSGALIEVTGGWVAHFRDGLVTSFHAHGDRAKALAAVGIG